MFALCSFTRAQTELKDEPSDRKSSSVIAANQGKLRLFICSADKDVWKTWLPTGIFHGPCPLGVKVVL